MNQHWRVPTAIASQEWIDRGKRQAAKSSSEEWSNDAL